MVFGGRDVVPVRDGDMEAEAEEEQENGRDEARL